MFPEMGDWPAMLQKFVLTIDSENFLKLYVSEILNFGFSSWHFKLDEMKKKPASKPKKPEMFQVSLEKRPKCCLLCLEQFTSPCRN